MERVVSCGSGDQRWRTKLHFGSPESLDSDDDWFVGDMTTPDLRRRMAIVHRRSCGDAQESVLFGGGKSSYSRTDSQEVADTPARWVLADGWDIR
jgi:hypothetical protein